MDEFELIERIARILRARTRPDPRVVLGIGDDGAVLAPRSDRVVATTDTLVEGVHFRLDLGTPRDAGIRAVAVNLSDLAAMGARPLALLIGLQLPPAIPDRTVLDLMRGVAIGSRRYGVTVAGGNVCTAVGPLSIAVTALGEADGNAFLRRDGARTGDGIWASGTLGDAGLGLALLVQDRVRALAWPALVRAFLRPVPRVALGLTLVGTAGVTAAIDVSDGLLQDLGHVLKASRVGATVDVAAVPMSRSARRLARITGADAMGAALSGGDDYQLLACARPAAGDALRSAGMTRIGTVTRGRRLVLMRDGHEIEPPPQAGWMHRR